MADDKRRVSFTINSFSIIFAMSISLYAAEIRFFNFVAMGNHCDVGNFVGTVVNWRKESPMHAL